MIRKIITAVAVTLLAATAMGAAPERDWKSYTNTENSRRFAMSPVWVAVATSGGVRTFRRETGKWRTWTMNDGLPSQDIVDLRFDAAEKNLLWVSSANSSDPWSGRLALTQLDLNAGMVRPVPADGRAPIETPVRPPLSGGGLHRLVVAPHRVVWASTRGMTVYDRATRRTAYYRLLRSEQIGPPLSLSLDSGDLRYTAVKWLRPRQLRTSTAYLLTLRLDAGSGTNWVESRVRISPAEARRREQAPHPWPDPLHGASVSDFVDEGDTLWFATCNHPGIRAGGVSRYLVRDGRWVNDAPEGEIPANGVSGLATVQGGLRVVTMNGTGVYDPRQDRWQRLDIEAYAHQAAVEPGQERQVPDGRGRWMAALAEEGRYVWSHDTRPYAGKTQRWRYVLTRWDRQTRTLESFEQLPALADLSVIAVLPEGRDLWLLCQDAQRSVPGHLVGTAVVVRWDRSREQFRRYEGGTLAEATLASLRRSGNYEGGAGLFRAAGQTWLGFDRWLLRYDAGSDDWKVETRGVWALYAYPDALWLRTLNPNNTGDLPAQQFFEWRPDAGWRQLRLDPQLTPYLHSFFQRDNEYYWFAGRGVLRLRRSTAVMEPNGPAGIGG